MRVLGIGVMLFVAFNDATLAVLARKMKELHFSALNLTCLVIAYQNDKSVTVSLLAYIELVYVIVADLLIFDQKFVPMEIIGASIITFFNIITICYKMKYTT